MLSQCSKCGEWFERTKPPKQCNKCLAAYQREYMRKYRAERPGFEMERFRRRVASDPQFLDDKRRRGREYWADLRHKAIMRYGGYACACCGECEPTFMTIDHIFNDGNVHRKEMGNDGRGSGTFKWLRDHGYPEGFQVLCMNCNHGKALNGGVCPHKSPKVEAQPA